MSKLSLRARGSFSKTYKFLDQCQNPFSRNSILDNYGRLGVSALKDATPVKTGKTASSWDYKIKTSRKGASISWYNTNTNDGVKIALILQYGHATKDGYFIQGRDYINPTMQKVFDEIGEQAWKEITK